ncbi:MAG: hypothetical protein JWO59_2355 [Chloroflexi bacterium]|nr:hypothetical protein [Chloroflexota bacterium]
MTAPAVRVHVPTAQPVAGHRSMAAPMPSTGGRISRLVATAIFWLATVLYVVVFSAISLRQYQAYVPHALDLGNMTQAFWNTVHGHLFHFQNMRQNASIEAFGTDTRLSFHVEPIIPFLSIIYFFWQHVETLLIMQVVAVATGAFPTRLLARRHLKSPLAEVAFPVAYLLFPALEAANLYEFHPVTFAAPLLLWAFYFADSRRYTLFTLTAVAAVGCKEELGVLVALMGLWIAVRNGERQFGAVIGVLGLAWSFVALKVVVPHFNAGDSSYWDRYVPPGFLGNKVVLQSDAIRFWISHPDMVRDNLTSEGKLSYLHRMLFPTGYLSLLSPLTLLIGLPSLILILLSYEPHMFSGVAHYSAELVPVTIVSAIFGAKWFARVIAPRIRVSFTVAVTICSIYVLATSLVNHRANGFSPLAEHPIYPSITAHDQVVDRVLAMIPPNASVSAQDDLNAHLSDRANVFLYPDLNANLVDYVVLDATQPTGSVIRPCDLSVQITGVNAACDLAAGPAAPAPATHSKDIDEMALLLNGRWSIVWAEDGVLLLKRHVKGEALITTLPPQFFTFMNPPNSGVPTTGPIARFGDYLELEGYQIDRTELVNLRNPDIVVTTWWRLLKPLPSRARLVHYLTGSSGALRVFSDDQQATDWSVLSRWQPGKVYKVTSYQLTVTTDHSGSIDADIGLSFNDQQYLDLNFNQNVTVLKPQTGILAVGGGKVLKLASIHASL